MIVTTLYLAVVGVAGGVFALTTLCREVGGVAKTGLVYVALCREAEQLVCDLVVGARSGAVCGRFILLRLGAE